MPVNRDDPAPRRRRRGAALVRLAAAAALGAATTMPVPALADPPGSVLAHQLTVPDGEVISVDLLAGATGVRPGSARLLLDAMPAGSTLTADGRRLRVPDEGIWQIQADGRHVTFTPTATRFGREPTILRYAAVSANGAITDPAIVHVTIPLLRDMVRADLFGKPVNFDVSGAEVGIDPKSLRLALSGGETGAQVLDSGTRIVAQGQGVWKLDRAHERVVFTPESPAVRTVDSIRIEGADANGKAASAGRLSVGYPHLADASAADRPGMSVQFSPMDDARQIRADSLVLTTEGMPPGSKLTESGRKLTVPGQGTWTIDGSVHTVTFTPSSRRAAPPTPAVIQGADLYADNPTKAVLRVQVTSMPPTVRSDHLRTVPGRSTTADLLANDTPGSAQTPLDPASIELQSFDAINLPGNARGVGTTLVVPDQGTFEVRPDGVLVFTPAKGFIGRTTPVRYFVTDGAGVKVSEVIQVDVDPDSPPGPSRRDTSGVNSLLVGILPDSPATSAVFGSIAAMFLFAGAGAAWIGSRMDHSAQAAYRAEARARRRGGAGLGGR